MTADRLLTVDQVEDLIAELEGTPGDPVPVKAVTLTFYASQSRRRDAAGELTIHDMPLPVSERWEPRDKPGKGPGRVRKPLWSEAQIRAWRAAGRKPFHHPRDPAGRLLPKQEWPAA